MPSVESELELVILEDLLEDDTECESLHLAPENPICTGPITHRLGSCVHELNACFGAYHAYFVLQQRGTICDGCGKPATGCWTFIPV